MSQQTVVVTGGSAGGADFRAHREFDRRAPRWDPQLGATRHHSTLAASGPGPVGAAPGWPRSRR